MVVKSLLISGNLPENGITFCYKPHPCQKPGFPRMTSLCAAEHQSACSAGCQRVKQKTRSGKAGKPRGGGAGGTELSCRSRGWTRRGCGAAGASGDSRWSVGSAFSCLGQRVSLGLGGLIFCCLLSFGRGAQCFPAL